MSVDPSWSQPLTDWQPNASFREAVTPPSAGPSSGTLVQLPCINEDWLQLVLGSLDQLRNPSTWLDTLSDSARATVIGQVDYLRSLVGKALGSTCVNPVTGVALVGCELVATLADGSTQNVLEFGHDNCACDVNCAFPPVPPNPGPSPKEKHACNISGYLATEVIERTMKAVSDNLTNCGAHLPSCQTIAQWASQLTALFAPYLPATAAAVIAFNDVYQEASAQLLSEVQAAATDPALWSSVTCAIFNAIRGVGYVTPGNFNAIVANLAAISYVYAWVPNDLSIFVGNMGFANFQALQTVGALDDVDCSSCGGSWCTYFDFTASQQGWGLDPGDTIGFYSPGNGWRAQTFGVTAQEIGISIDLPFPANITGVDIFAKKDHADNGFHSSFAQCEDPAGVTVTSRVYFPGVISYPASAWFSGALSGVATRFTVVWSSNGTDDSDHLEVQAVQIRGTGTCPFTNVNNCVH